MQCLILITLFTSVVSSTDIRLPPRILSQSEKEETYQEGTDFTLKCKASGQPQVEYEWTRNGELQTQTNRIRIDNGDMTIEDMRVSDEAYYQCKASNQNGASFTVVTFLRRGDIRLTDPNDHWIQNPGGYARQEGEAFSKHPVAWTGHPPPSFKWFKVRGVVETELPMDARITTGVDGTLYFAYLEMEDASHDETYKCEIHGRIPDKKLGSTYFTLNVSRSREDTRTPVLPQRFTPASARTTLTVLTQTTAQLKCFFKGYPLPVVEWDFNRDAVRGRYHLKDFNTLLEIDDVRESDQAEYRCRGVNDVGETAYDTIYLNVESVPTFRANGAPIDKNVTQGGSVSFHCKTDADPPAEVQWYVNDEKIDRDNPGTNNRRISDDHLTLTFEDACKTSCGPRDPDVLVVRCNASNHNGYAYSAAYLNTLLPVTIVDIPVDVSLTQNETGAVFNCSCTKDDSEEATVTWFRHKGGIPSRIYPEDDTVYTVDENNALHIDLSDVEQKDLHTYEAVFNCSVVTASNSKWASAELILVDAPPPPDRLELSKLWWMFLLIVLLILLILLILLCCICRQRNKGDDYPVDEKEREHGLDPEKDLEENGFQPYSRPLQKSSSRLELDTIETTSGSQKNLLMD